jgi:glycosyltransferase involved in cell wall biosynthesis
VIIGTPKVSHIIICYNQVGFIEEAVRSAVNQDYASFEVIICDDGSTDGTKELISSLVDEFPSIIKVHLSDVNSGVTANCNTGLSLATGLYVSFQGGDDILMPGKITAQVKKFTMNPSLVLCYHDVAILDDHTHEIIGRYSDRHPLRKGSFVDLIIYGAFFCATSVMAKRTHFPANGFDLRIPFASDWLFWCLTVYSSDSKEKNIDYCDGNFAVYRRHDSNITSTLDSNTIAELKAGYEILSERCSERKFLINIGFAKRLLIYSVKFLIKKDFSNFNQCFCEFIRNPMYVLLGFLAVFYEFTLFRVVRKVGVHFR